MVLPTANARNTSTRQTSRGRRPSGSKGSRNGTNPVRAERHGPVMDVPVVGTITLPPPEHLIWYGATFTLAALELIDWPIAVLVAVGKALADNRHNQTLENVGDALENAG